MDHLFSRQSIKHQMLVLVFLFILSFVFLFYYGFYRIADYRYTDQLEYMEDQILRLQANLLSRIEFLSDLIPGIAYNPLTQKYLRSRNDRERYEIFLDLDKTIGSLQELIPGLISVVLVSEGGNSYAYSPEYGEQIDAFIGELPQLRQEFYSGRKTIRMNQQPRDCIFVGTQIYDMESGFSSVDILGQMIVILDIEQFLLMNQAAQDLFFIGRDGTFLYAPPGSGETARFDIGDRKQRGAEDFSLLQLFSRNDLLLYREIAPMDAVLAGRIDKERLFTNLLQVMRGNSILLLILILAVSVLSTLIVSNILSAHRSMLSFVQGISWENLEKDNPGIRVSGYREARILGENLTKMVSTLHDLTHGLIRANSEIYELELSNRKAEMDYLINQINPHFLFNVLESIKGIAASRNFPEIREITYNLGGMFHYTLKSERVVSLKDELTVVRQYLDIQSLRFQDRFSYSLEIPWELQNAEILKMIIQPLAENAVIHGLEQMPDGGRLAIRAHSRGDTDLILSVSDNGPGMGMSQLEALQKKLDALEDHPSRGIGLANVHKRLRLHYGAGYGLEIASGPGGGMKVLIRLPFKEYGSV